MPAREVRNEPGIDWLIYIDEDTEGGGVKKLKTRLCVQKALLAQYARRGDERRVLTVILERDLDADFFCGTRFLQEIDYRNFYIIASS